MKSYEITGKLERNNKKGKVTEVALDKQEVWNNPRDFGFLKVFSVREAKGLTRGFDKREPM